MSAPKKGPPGVPRGLRALEAFPLTDALFGRRARRFSLGATVPSGPLAFTSKREPIPLTELEQMLVLVAAGGNTGWHSALTYNATYAPNLPNYSAAAGGRTFPSAAGFHTSDLFFTDDHGVYLLETRDAPSLTEDGELSRMLDAHRARIRRLQPERLKLANVEPYVEAHNHWCVNRPGTTLIMPVGDLAQHVLLVLCYLVQNRFTVVDDIHGSEIPGLDRARGLLDPNKVIPLSYLEQLSLTELTAELSASCFAGMLMLQAMGLGGWMFDGIDRHALLGASGDPESPGLGFQFEVNDRWPLPNVTGLPGVFEAHCPPHYPDMRAAVDAVITRKFGPGGPFHPDTPGPWRDSRTVRSAAQIHDEATREAVTTIAQHVLDRFGKFPGTVPAVFSLMYLQAHHLDLEFYDHHFTPGFYLRTHADHFHAWH